jgi:DHA1 family bicyclomycin/chloramphenicol resistance-like MFS transporter
VAQEPAGAERPVSTAAVALVTGFGPFGTDAYLPALPAVSVALMVSASTSQLTITVFLIGLAVGQLLAGPISDAAGRRRLMLGGAVLLVLASAACVISPDAPTLLAARVAQGLAAGSGSAVGVAVISDRFSGVEAAARFGTLSAIRLIAPVIAPGIGGVILLATDFRGVFVFMTALSAVVLVVTALGIPESLPPARRQPGGVRHLAGRIGALLQRPAFRAPVIVQCLATAGFFVYIGGSSFVLQQQYGISQGLYSIVFATDAAAMVVTSVLFRRLILRAAASRLRLVGLVMSSAAAGVLLLVEVASRGDVPLAAVWILLGVAVAGNGFCIPATTVLAQAAGRDSAGTAASLSGGLSFLVGALTTPLTGLVGVQSVLVLGLGMTVLSTAALVLSRVLRPTGEA